MMRLIAALLGCSCLAFGADKPTAIDGVWRATMDGLPALVLTISDEGGGLRGAMLFYLIRRDPGQSPHADPGIPEPLFNLKWDGTELSFQVSHRRAHPPRTVNDPPVTFRLKITARNEGLLVREGPTSDQIRVARDE